MDLTSGLCCPGATVHATTPVRWRADLIKHEVTEEFCGSGPTHWHAKTRGIDACVPIMFANERECKLMSDAGTGPGVITNDGCPVDVYAALSPRHEADLVRALVTPGASVLELGVGTGLLAEPLAASGLRVVGVDDSPEMLSYLERAEPVLAKIEHLELDERFDVVLLASHLVNTADEAERRLFIATAARHCKPGGHVVAEWHTPTWFDGLVSGRVTRRTVGDFAVSLEVKGLVEGLLTATVAYERRSRRWTQDFQARRLTRADLSAAFDRSGLLLGEALTDDESWVVARPA